MHGVIAGSDRRRWVVLAVGLVGLIAGCAAQYGLAFLIPAMRAEGLTLQEASLLVTAPIAGIMCTLIAWGAAADRWGERITLALGLVGAGIAQLGAATVDYSLARWLLLFLVGASSASIHSASGRLILGWFGARERGLAMGIRQMGLPLGIGVAALTLPSLGADGVTTPLIAVGAACLGAAALIVAVVTDPLRAPRAAGEASASPYRRPYLWRIHAASGLLVIPQIAVAVFAFDYLVHGLGWSVGAAGLLVAGTQIAGAFTRLIAGWWSDRVGSRLRPMRTVAVTIGVAVALLAVLGIARDPLAVVALALAGVVTTTSNGLAFTAVAERAGSRWAGRALGVQNTFQNAIGALVPTPLAVVIGSAGGGALGYALAFATVAAFPFIAAVVVPVGQEGPVERGP
jgi:sugar phosphate permease